MTFNFKDLFTKPLPLFSILILSGTTSAAQEQSGIIREHKPPAVSDSAIYRKVTIKAEPNFNWHQYLQESLQFPEAFMEEQVSVKIYVELIIEKNGSLSNPRALRTEGQINNNKATAEQLNPFIDEACRVALQSPQWIPAIEDGRAVRSYFIISILFNRD